MGKDTATERTTRRTATRRTEMPRTPSRTRGKARYAALIQATASLLETRNPATVGLTDIAKAAKIPAASIYHFFPSKEAAFVALAQHYMDRLDVVHRTPIEARKLGSWQDLFRIDVERAASFYNSHRPAMKLFYAGSGGLEPRDVDKVYTLEIARCQYARLNSIFHMPHISDPEPIFEIRTALLDAVWSVSVRRHGCIVDEMVQEAYEICAGYTAQFLPRRIERRQSLIDAAARDEHLVLPITARTAPDAGDD